MAMSGLSKQLFWVALICSVFKGSLGTRWLLNSMAATAIATPTGVLTATSPAASVMRAASPGLSITIAADPNLVASNAAPTTSYYAPVASTIVPAASHYVPPTASPVPSASENAPAVLMKPALPIPQVPCPTQPVVQPAVTPWQFGVCPLVVRDADYVGFDVAQAYEPDVATCCEQCHKSLVAWKEANPHTNALPTVQDNVCIAWTYTAEKMCYLKNGGQNIPIFCFSHSNGAFENGTHLTISAVPGSYTGLFAGNVSSLQPLYDEIVKTYLLPLSVRSTASAVVASAPGDAFTSVSSQCSDPHCQQIYAGVNTTAASIIAPGMG